MNNEIAEKQLKYIKERCLEIKPLVAIRCITYNHESYIKDALDGFVMQKTDFPFVAIVHDDASTDKTVDIIREYAEKYPDIIFPIFEQENQYSKRDGSLRSVMNIATEATCAKYVALCEGDDYWIDPLKLQKQVNFLESHPDYTLVATNYHVLENGALKKSWIKKEKDDDLTTKDIIINGGLYLTTASLLFRSKDYLNIPPEITKLHVGDYPLQIYLSHIGKTRFINGISVVYRYKHEGSWTNKNINKYIKNKELKNLVNKELYLLETLNNVTSKQYYKIFKKRANLYKFQQYILKSPFREFFYILKDPITIFRYQNKKKIIFSLLPANYKKKKYLKNKS